MELLFIFYFCSPQGPPDLCAMLEVEHHDGAPSALYLHKAWAVRKAG